MPKKRNKLALPLLLGAITFALILMALWPSDAPETTVVVAAKDLGAGAVLAAADLTTITLPADQAPPGATSDPAPLIGQSLAVVRFAGEPVGRPCKLPRSWKPAWPCPTSCSSSCPCSC